MGTALRSSTLRNKETMTADMADQKAKPFRTVVSLMSRVETVLNDPERSEVGCMAGVLWVMAGRKWLSGWYSKCVRVTFYNPDSPLERYTSVSHIVDWTCSET